MEEWFQMAIDRYSTEVRLKPYAKEYLLFLKERGIKLEPQPLCLGAWLNLP